MTQITDKAIRDYMGHNGAECRVRVTRDGRVLRHGSPEPTDRSRDYWAWLGWRDDIVERMGREGGSTR